MLATIRDRYLLALQYQDYRTLWTANTFSGAASWALIIARGWLAYEVTEEMFWVGLVTLAAMIPRLFATPLFGFLADRFDRQSLLRSVYTLEFAHNVVLALLVMQGVVQGPGGLWVLLVLSLVNGTMRSGQMTITQSLVPNLVPKEYLLNAIALNQATQQGSRMVGALAIIPLLAVLGPNGLVAAFWLCSGFYLIGLIQVSRIKTRSTGVIDPARSFFRNLIAGFEYVYGRPQILAMVLLVLAHCALTMSYESILPGISVDKLGAGSVGMSYLIGAVGAGALTTSIFLAGVKSARTRGIFFLVFGITSGLGPILMALSSSRELSILAAAAMGANQAGFMTISHTIIQSLVDDNVRGRVSGVYSVHVGGSMAVTNFINAYFADLFSASAVMAVGGALFIIVITISVGSGVLRRIYFPKLAPTPVTA
ncbi:MAG: MFS transporter [Chloroflexi bacterium]|nr:MFS transporter [Chloroflexota bacterium]